MQKDVVERLDEALDMLDNEINVAVREVNPHCQLALMQIADLVRSVRNRLDEDV